MAIYTKTGDDGTTSLVGGRRVSKCCTRLEAYGTVDELNSHLGLLHTMCVGETARNAIIDIQKTLFGIGALLATEESNAADAVADAVASGCDGGGDCNDGCAGGCDGDCAGGAGGCDVSGAGGCDVSGAVASAGDVAGCAGSGDCAGDVAGGRAGSGAGGRAGGRDGGCDVSGDCDCDDAGAGGAGGCDVSGVGGCDVSGDCAGECAGSGAGDCAGSGDCDCDDAGAGEVGCDGDRDGWQRVRALERLIDTFQQGLPSWRGFTLPGGSPSAAQANVCRAVCRRAERCILRLSEESAVRQWIVVYINRLSDLLYVMGLHENQIQGRQEILWRK